MIRAVGFLNMRLIWFERNRLCFVGGAGKKVSMCFFSFSLHY